MNQVEDMAQNQVDMAVVSVTINGRQFRINSMCQFNKGQRLFRFAILDC